MLEQRLQSCEEAMKLYQMLTAFLVQLLTSLPILASPIVPANDGVNTIVSQNGQTFNITGGTQAGANLFHSLQKFGLDANQIANFISRPEIANILTRVVGGEASIINGLIQVTGGNSNLYILNPAGIIFGANASLNVPAAFTATTANAIQVGNGYFSINSTVEQIRQLTGDVKGFAFSSFNTSFDNKPSQGIILNQGNLTGSGGKEVVLLGGIVINTGTVNTPHGKIIISALPDGKYVRITTEGGLVSYDLPLADNQDLSTAGLRPIQPTDFPALLTGRTTGTTEVSGTLSTASSTVNPNSVIFISGETVRLHNAILNNEGTDGTIRLQISTSTPITGFTFLDRVRNYEQIANALTAGNQLILLNRSDSGIAKVSQVLAGKTDVKNLQFVSDGNAGQIWLGRDFITNDTLASYETQISNWKQALAPSADILFFTCNLAQTADGQLLLTRIGNLTNANIAASTDITGNARYGGNWVLEYGNVNTAPSFNLDKLQFADVKLVTFTVTDLGDTGASGQLRDAISQANNTAGLDDIKFALNGTITLNGTELTVNDPAGLIINGNGVSNTIIDGNNTSRVFNVTAGDITFDGVTIRNGNANFGGGGIWANGTVSLTNSTVSDNTASNFGGGIYASGTVSLTNSTVSDNAAAFNGGGIWAGGTVTLTNSTVSDNTAGLFGGGIFTFDAVSLTNSTVSGNTAGVDGGGIYASGTVSLTNSTVSDNTAGFNGGGIYASGTVSLTNSTVSDNTANFGSGGGIFTFDAVSLTNSTVSDNTASNFGGGILANGTVSLTNSTVSGNTAGVDGGGIYASGTVSLTNSTVSDNTASNFGGGILAGSTVTLTNSTVSGNAASIFDGGGIFTFDAVSLTNSTVSDNTAGFNGGGIRAFGTVTLTNSTVSGNAASIFDGGGIYASGTVTLTNSTVSDNTAGFFGGGILAGSTVTLTNSTVSDNTAGVNGGGIWAGGTVSLTNSTVSDNTAGFNGGGILAGSTVTLTNSTVSGNAASILDGGGIYASGTVTLTNSTVSGNTAASGDGGGIWAGSGATIRNSTIAFNTANNGGGIYRNNGTIDIGNSIVAQNTAGTSPDIGSSTPSVGYTNAGWNLIGDNTGFATTFTNGVNGTIIGVNPMLAPLANNGGVTQTHALLPGSPAINAGNNALIPMGVTEDQRGTGFPRIAFTTVDIGAFEVQPTPPTVPNIQPETLTRTISPNLFCLDWDEFVPVNYQGTIIKVPIEKCQ
jgi:filamentous hemagglutinin family protein